MKQVVSAALIVLGMSVSAIAQATRPAIFIPPTGDGFEVDIAAAMAKKNVPASVVTHETDAALTLKAGQVHVQKESGRMKVAKCVFQHCAETGDKASASVQLVDRRGSVVWSYAVDRDDTSRKELAEAIASRLKRDYFKH